MISTKISLQARRRLGLVSISAISLFLIVLLFGCTSQITGQNVLDNTEEPIMIGVMGPFTGSAAIFGEMMQNGLDLALAELPKEYKSMIKIIKEDDMCNGKQAVTVAQKLINVDNVKYVIGPLCNEATLATENLFEDNKVLSLTIGLPSNKIADMGEYHFSFSPEIEYLMKKITSKISDDGHKKIAIIHMSATFENENYVQFVKHTKESGANIVEDQAAIKGATDFRANILKLKEANPEAIMIIAHTTELVNILNQMEELRIGDIPKYGIHAAESPVLLINAKETSEGLTFPYPADKSEITSAREYNIKYKQMYNLDVDPYSANAYDSLNILVNVINDCGKKGDTESECVRQKLAEINNYAGANGLLSVDSRGVGTYKEIMIKEVKDGRFQKIG